MMTVIVNGNEKTVEAGMTLLELLKELGLEGKVMAAAINMEIVKQDQWAQHKLVDGDKLELLDFVGGG
jgi:sulfur carrier protein